MKFSQDERARLDALKKEFDRQLDEEVDKLAREKGTSRKIILQHAKDYIARRNVPVNLKGTIGGITPDGGSAMIVLSEPFEGLTYAVLSFDTVGRIALMNRHDGKLLTGTEITLTKVSRGPDAWMVNEIEVF